MWICSKCQAEVEPTFEVCWACGTTIDGDEDPGFVTADESLPIEESSVAASLSQKRCAPLDEDWGPSSSPPVECYRARDSAEAQFLIDLLAEQGILALANGTSMGNTEYVLPLFSPRIEVRPEDYSHARAIIEQFEYRRKARRAGAERF